MKPWIQAFRLRTLPLSLSCIGMGGILAGIAHQFNATIFFLCCLTTIFLQILSNLANDLGDSLNGADHAGRKGPLRAVQSGAISVSQMKNAVILFSVLCLVSGLSLLYLAFGWNLKAISFFLLLGLLSIVAAITYTIGKKPYGYAGLGDLSVFIFFGLVGVIGSQYLFTKSIHLLGVLPALSCGLFSIAVLNINNIRDIESDRLAGKFSIPVRIGKERAAQYHWVLLSMGLISAILFVGFNYQSPIQFLFLLTAPLLFVNAKKVMLLPSEQLDPLLKQMALTTLIFVILFGLGNLLV
ncbi:MAG TPA: 1,4-dihydroxy-2-naphthoate octaprenyltransferase [Cytophagales bacterium]|jgi:1,4-dihydroxy-2-naphthoate polyprenyltransferase|nr:1,4-dihydroxy-2-naphthoate octaprenyltransferase [Cytophagales bacterium]